MGYPAFDFLKQQANEVEWFARTNWGRFGRLGRSMPVERLTLAEARIVVEAADCHGGLRAFRPKQCYCNSQRIALTDDRFQYAEGFVCSDLVPIPLDHAWLLLNGKVIDLTLRNLDKREKRPPTLNHYLGIVIPLKLLRRNALETEMYSPVSEGPFAREVFAE